MAKFRKLAALCMSFAMIAALGLTACEPTKAPNGETPGNEQPTFDGYTVTVKMPDGSAAPSTWKLQYCIGDKCYDAAIGEGGVAKFEAKAEGDVYSLKLIFVQSDVEYDYDVITTSPDVKEYVIQLREQQVGDGSQENPYVVIPGKTYASVQNAETYSYDYFVFTPEVDGTLAFTVAEKTELVNFNVSLADLNNQLEVKAGIPFVFSVAAYDDDYNAIEAQFTMNFTAATEAFTADGTPYKPLSLTANEEITEEFPEDVYYRYYQFVAPADGVYKITSNNEWTYFGSLLSDEEPSIGLGYEIKAGEMLILYHGGADITWTFNFATDGSIAVSKPGDSAELPLSVTEAGEVTATVAAGAQFYVSVKAMLQVTIPEGFVANTMGFAREEFAAGDVYAFDDYHPRMNSEELLLLTNLGETEATLVLNFTEYVYVNPNPDLEGKGTQDEPYVLNTGDLSVVCDATNGVIFAYYFYGTADTLEFTNLSNVKIFSTSASMAGITPNEEVTSFTNTNMEPVVYFIVYTIDETQPATFTVTFTEATAE